MENPDDGICGGLPVKLLDRSFSEPVSGGPVLHCPIHINALPIELLGEVFIYYVDSIPSNNRSPRTMLFELPKYTALRSSPERPHSPALLGCVCSRWRRTALSMPILWKDIWTAKPTAPDTASLFKLWLKRSGSRPLHITLLHIAPWGEFAQSSSMQRVTLDAISQSHRLRAIRMDLDQNGEQVLSALQPCKMPLLEEFSAELLHWSDESSLRLFNWVSSAAPNLREVTFGRSCTGAVLSADMPWERLTHIQLCPAVKWPAVHTILARCSSLQHLTLSNVESWSEDDPVTNILSLPSLQSLKLCQPMSYPSMVFDALHTPSLVQLDLQMGSHSNYLVEGPFALIGLFRRSNCYLRSLTWSRSLYEGDEKPLIRILAQPLMHKLVHLTILARATDRVLQFLTHTNGLEQKRLPALRTIVLDECVSTDGVLSAMVLSRVGDRSVRKLELVRAVLHRDRSIRNPTFVEDMSLKSKVPGMTIDISCA